MNYIDNIALSILLQLHRVHEIKLYANDRSSIKELKEYIRYINNALNDRLDDLSEEDETFKQYITCTTLFGSITIKCEDLERIENYLNNYITAYVEEDLKEYGHENEYDTMTVLTNELIGKVESSTKSLKRYITTKFRYTPFVVEKYLQNNDFIRDMEVKLTPPEDVEYPVKIYMYMDDDEIYDRYPDWEDYFECRYVLDLSEFVEEYKQSKSKTITKKRRKNFAPLQKKLYRYLYNNAKEGVFMLSKADLKNCITLTSKDKKLNDLRNQYREIFNKLPDFNIISYNRSTQLYDIHKDILTDKVK